MGEKSRPSRSSNYSIVVVKVRIGVSPVASNNACGPCQMRRVSVAFLFQHNVNLQIQQYRYCHFQHDSYGILNGTRFANGRYLSTLSSLSALHESLTDDLPYSECERKLDAPVCRRFVHLPRFGRYVCEK